MSIKKILIVNLKRNGDIFQMGNIVKNIKNNNANCEIDILCLEEFEKAAETLNYINEIYKLDRKKVETIMKTKIFNKGFAINIIIDLITKIRAKKYSKIVNYSNDEKSILLTTLLSKDSYHDGSKYRNDGTLDYSNKWSIVYNECLSNKNFNFVHLTDCINNIIDLNTNLIQDEAVIKSNPKYDRIAQNSFLQIRNSFNNENKNIKVVGIQLKSSQKNKDIPKSTLTQLCKIMLENEEYIPVLLISPCKEEKEYANEISKDLDSSLIIIESDFKALPSVLNELDALVTPDTSVKHVADLLNTKILEISCGNAPYRLQGTIGIENIILRTEDNRNLTADAIIQGLNCLFKEYYYKLVDIPEAVTFYVTIRDEEGFLYKPITNNFCRKKYLSYLAGRELIHKLCNEESSTSAYNSYLSNVDAKTFKNWQSYELSFVQEASRKLLSTIRSLLYLKENKKSSANFLRYLNELLDLSESSFLGSIPILFFKSISENEMTDDQTSNLELIEQSLYKLKKDFQILINIINEKEEVIREHILERNIKQKDGRASNNLNKLSYL